MKTIRLRLTSTLLALCVLPGVHAADIGFIGDIGTTGIGAHIALPITSSINARIGLNGLDYSFNSSTSDVSYKAKVKLGTIDALTDWYPTNNGFHITAGLVYNDNKATLNGQAPNGNYTINGNTYNITNTGTLNGTVNFRKIAPYLGVGWGNPVTQEKGWGFSSDLGMIFQGNATTTLTSSGCTASAAVCTQLSNDLAVENNTLGDKVRNLTIYPVLRIGASYHF